MRVPPPFCKTQRCRGRHLIRDSQEELRSFAGELDTPLGCPTLVARDASFYLHTAKPQQLNHHSSTATAPAAMAPTPPLSNRLGSASRVSTLRRPSWLVHARGGGERVRVRRGKTRRVSGKSATGWTHKTNFQFKKLHLEKSELAR